MKTKQKRNAMSKNEIKRQNTLFNNLPIISKKKPEQLVVSQDQDKVGTSYIEDRKSSQGPNMNQNQVESKTITENNSFHGAPTEAMDAQSPTGQRLSTYGENATLNADVTKRGDDREPTPDYSGVDRQQKSPAKP